MIAITITPRAPNPAASVGVAMPRMITPITLNTTIPKGKTLTTTAHSISAMVVESTSYSGAASGSSFTCT